jgi:hypothetical protein
MGGFSKPVESGDDGVLSARNGSRRLAFGIPLQLAARRQVAIPRNMQGLEALVITAQP